MNMKNPNIPKTHLSSEEDLPLIQFTHTFSQGSVWLAMGMDKQIATYDLVARELPAHRNYMAFGGLEEMALWISKLKFSAEEISYLLKLNIISKEFASYLENFKFTGSVYAMPEGTIFFPQEPVVRVSAPLIEASLVEIFLMNAFVSNTAFLTKACRIKTASKNKFLLSTGPLRAHSFESGFKASRAGYIAGMKKVANLSFVRKYGLETGTPVVNAQHLFIKSFPDELTAFRALASFFPDTVSFMIETYDFKHGVENAIILAKEMKTKGKKLVGVAIDSGDLIAQSKYARKRLDDENCREVKIFLASNLDEYKIKQLVDAGTPCDLAVVGTEYTTLFDSPKLEVVYKLAELNNKGTIHYTAKLTPGKLSYPGKKQVFRLFDNGIMIKDIIGLEKEGFSPPLLIEIIKNGQLNYNLPLLDSIGSYLEKQLQSLPPRLLELDDRPPYAVEISGQIEKILNDLKQKHIAK